MKLDTRSLLIDTDNNKLYQLSDEEQIKLKQTMLEIAVDIFDFCRNHNLVCMLCGGSAIGAVRHNGFIPWDDDLDIAMPRKDYEIFSENFELEYGDKYRVYAPCGKHHITRLFMKVSKKHTLLEDIYTSGSKYKTGVVVDIFPIENVPKNPVVRKMKGIFSDIFAYAVVSEYLYENRNDDADSVYAASRKKKMLYTARLTLGKIMSFRHYQWWYRKYDRFSAKTKETGIYTIPTGRGHYAGEIQEKNVFFPVEKCMFENVELAIPGDVDKYLKKLYGDYMIMPPEDKRERHYYTIVKV